MRSRDSRVERGLTLIELLVVMALLAVISGLAVPLAFRGMSSLEVRAAARELAATVNLARDLAATSRVPHRLEFDEEDEGGAFRLLREEGLQRRLFVPPPPEDAPEPEPEEEEEPGDVLVLRLPLEVLLLEMDTGSAPDDDALPAVHFDPRGHSSGGRIVLGDDRVAYSVVLSRAAGLIRVERDHRDEWE